MYNQVISTGQQRVGPYSVYTLQFSVTSTNRPFARLLIRRHRVPTRVNGHVLRPRITFIVYNNNNSYTSNNNLVFTPLHLSHPRIAVHEVNGRRLHTLHTQGVRQFQHTNDNRQLWYNLLTSNKRQGILTLGRRQHVGLVVRGARIVLYHGVTRARLLLRNRRFTSQIIQITRRRHVTSNHGHTFSNIRIRRPLHLSNFNITTL